MGRGRQGPRQKFQDLQAMIENLLQNVPITHGTDFVEWEHLAEAEADHQTIPPEAEVVDLTMLVNLMISQEFGSKAEGNLLVPR